MSYFHALESTNVWENEATMHHTHSANTDQYFNMDDADMNDETAVSDLVMIRGAASEGAAHGSRKNLTEGTSIGLGADLRRRRENVDLVDSEHIQRAKRVAISGPNQRTLDDLRQGKEITRQRVIQHSVLIQSQRQEIQDLQNQLNNRAYQNALEGELESQMIDQIIQFEQQVLTLTNRNADLTSVLQDGGRQLQELQHHNNEMQKKLDELTMEHVREKARQNEEVLALRQRLQAAETAQSSQSVSHTPPRVIRNVFTRGSPARVGIVPLRPANPLPTPDTPASQTLESETSETIDLNTPRGVSNVTTIVKEVLNQLNITRTVVAEPHVRKPRRKSARTRDQQAKLAQRQILTKSEDLEWMDAVRNFWKTTFNITAISDFGQYEPAPANRVNAFETGQDGPDDSNVLDFQKGYERSRWNRVILTRLCAQILEERALEGNWGLPNVSEAYLMSLLSSQLKRSREAWSLVQARPNFEQNCMETEEDVINRVNGYTAMHLEAIGSRARRERKYQRRMKATEKILLLKSELNAPDLDTWKYFRDLLTKLSVDGMSSEEEGVETIGNVNVPVFRVKICVWRHPAVRDYFKFIDSESQNPVVRPSRGSKLHPHIMTDEPGQTQAPQKLPEKLYDPGWLQRERELKGQKWLEDELQVSRDVFELLQFVAP